MGSLIVEPDPPGLSCHQLCRPPLHLTFAPLYRFLAACVIGSGLGCLAIGAAVAARTNQAAEPAAALHVAAVAASAPEVDLNSPDAAPLLAERARVLEQQVERLVVENRQQQETAVHLRNRVAAAESNGPWLPLLLIALGAMVLVVTWLGWQLRVLKSRPRLARRRVGPEHQSSTGGSEPVALASPSPPPAPAAPGAPGAPVSAGASEKSQTLRPATLAAKAMANLDTTATVSFARDAMPAQGDAATASTDAGRTPRAVSVEEMLDLEQQADFFIVLGQDEAAIDLLVGHLRASGGASPLPYLKLLELYRQRGDTENHERIRQRFNQRFSAKAPAIDEEMYTGRSLEGYPEVLAKIEQLWTRPLAAMTELAALQTRQPGSMLFDLPAFRDLLLLGAMSRELAGEHALSSPDDSSDIDLTLPVAATARHDNRAAVRQALAARVTGTQALPPELMSHLLTPAALGAEAGGLDLDLSDAAPGPREFIRPATFTDVEKRGDGRHSEMSDFDSLEPPSRTRR